jgi:hypothetical protein
MAEIMLHHRQRQINAGRDTGRSPELLPSLSLISSHT